MKNFFDWYPRYFKGTSPSRPWLVVGKGPTFPKIRELDLDEYRILTLNHVVREMSRTAELAHMIDVDVLRGLEERQLWGAEYFVLPLHPHVAFTATAKDLGDFFAEYPKLKTLHEEERLLWYNLSTWKAEPGSPVVDVAYFSAEAAIRLLALAGARVIRTVGVDGGTQYAGEFKDLTPFTGGHSSFDLQWEGIHRTVREFAVDFARI